MINLKVFDVATTLDATSTANVRGMFRVTDFNSHNASALTVVSFSLPPSDCEHMEFFMHDVRCAIIRQALAPHLLLRLH